MHPWDRIVALTPVHLGEVADGAAGPDQSLALLQRLHSRIADLFGDVFAQRAHLAARRRVVFEELLTQPQPAQWQRVRAGHLARAERRDFQAAAPDVDERAVLDRKTVDRA